MTNPKGKVKLLQVQRKGGTYHALGKCKEVQFLFQVLRLH